MDDTANPVALDKWRNLLSWSYVPTGHSVRGERTKYLGMRRACYDFANELSGELDVR